MLKIRVVTALLLLAILLPSLFLLPQSGWAAFAAVLAALGAWEWGGLMRASPRARVFGGVALAALCLLWLACLPETLGIAGRIVPHAALVVYALALCFWLLAVPIWLRRKWPLPTGPAGWAIGAIVLFPPWLAIVQLRLPGPWWLLGILAVVWVADIGAYFFGCQCGRHKLAPTISPGKTWEGAIGGAVAVLAFGLLLRHFFAAESLPLLWSLLALLAMAVVSVVGDLFESLLKRQVGLKDSSGILPGHGGVLDRIDSLTSTLPLVAFCWLVMSP